MTKTLFQLSHYEQSPLTYGGVTSRGDPPLSGPSQLEGVNQDKFISSAGFSKLNAVVKYKYSSINGLAVNIPDFLVEKLLALEGVEYVEEDGVAHSQQVASWGLDRIDQRYLPLDNSYTAPSCSYEVTVYIIDTGLRHSHQDFGGRAAYHFDYQPSNGGEDCNGHGTHCGGTTSGSTYGVSPGSQVRSVRILSCFGSGSWTNVIAGVDSVAKATGLRVGSMSLGGGATQSLDDAVVAAFDAGAVMVVAAGNSNADACNYSPARVLFPWAITVAATDSFDNRASFSNYGSCIDIFAPGVSITSAWYTSDTASNTISGTSMACPHVAGCAASHLCIGEQPSTVPSAIVNEATEGVVGNPGRNSPNLLLCCLC
ncbi:extracellular serine proteinase-like [Amphiura filiformis]|uniref:extracellular serine proteinase-like n=1 Tax=Amphiura filiformis TaxID=82378 RepID=UPI003B2250DA